jgi:hypothetical protein
MELTLSSGCTGTGTQESVLSQNRKNLYVYSVPSLPTDCNMKSGWVNPR